MSSGMLHLLLSRFLLVWWPWLLVEGGNGGGGLWWAGLVGWPCW
jgi:hypothetical protein